ncbi:unnamed protein product [Cuscuta epithymum]|uniref:Btz domain-containing protein n=1 Tax=Cuscuta epithymum TaxID=186058 RepID=A0AAV0GJ12_9ASTE|nr:unnamed protein product [Cuscuta epithymum]
MSRLERRDSESRRHRSRFDEEPSPKRSRRESKPETERHLTDNTSNGKKNLVLERNNQLQPKDDAHRGSPSRQDYRTEKAARKVTEQKREVQTEGAKHSFSPKRSFRDSKPETEKPHSSSASDGRKNLDQEQKKQLHLHGDVHLDASSRQDYKTERAARTLSDQKRDAHIEGTKHSVSPKRSSRGSKPENERHHTINTSDATNKSDQEQNPPLQLVSEHKRNVYIEGTKHSLSPKRYTGGSKPESERHLTNNTPDVRKKTDQERKPPLQPVSDQKKDAHIEGTKHSLSPKRSTRGSKPETEMQLTNNALDLLPGAPSRHDYKTEKDARKVSDQKRDVRSEGVKHSSDLSELSQHRSVKRSFDPVEVPRSQSYFQHDERGNAGQAGRSSRRIDPDEHGQRRESKEQANRKTNHGHTPMGQKPKLQEKENDAWQHDGYFELEANPKPPAKKRSFREQKISVDLEKADKEETEPAKHNSSIRDVYHAVDRRSERSSYVSHRRDQSEKQFAREREANMGGAWRGRFPSRRDRPHPDSRSLRGRDTFISKPDYRPNKTVDKWKHDLFSEANKSPPPQSEEDRIAKIEALLAS